MSTEAVTTAMLLEEQRKTNALLEQLISVLSSGVAVEPEKRSPPERFSKGRKSKKDEQKEIAKNLLIKYLPDIKPYICQ